MAEEKQEKTETSKPQETGPAYKEEKPNPEIKHPEYGTVPLTYTNTTEEIKRIVINLNQDNKIKEH